MTSDTRRTIQFLAGLLLACILCWGVVIAAVWVVIQFLYFMGSVLVSIPAS